MSAGCRRPGCLPPLSMEWPHSRGEGSDAGPPRSRRVRWSAATTAGLRAFVQKVRTAHFRSEAGLPTDADLTRAASGDCSPASSAAGWPSPF